MKKILATILAFCLIFSAVGTAMFTVSAETEVVQEPFYTATVADKDWTFAEVDAPYSTLHSKALFSNYEIKSTGYGTIFGSETNVMDFSTAAEWIRNGTGEVRFWVMLPWQEGTPELSYYFDLGYYATSATIGNSYPESYAKISIAADGMWHEIRISASEFSAPTNIEKYAAAGDAVIGKFYGLRVKAAEEAAVIEAKGGFYCSNTVEYYNEPIAEEINDGNLEYTTYLIDSNSTGTGLSGLTFDNPKVADNKFVRTARRITRTGTEEEGWKAGNLYPYSIDSTGEEFIGFVENKGDMRAYVKNASNYDITVRIGVKGSFVNSKYSTTTVYADLLKEVPLPANEWVEVRMPYSEMGITDRTVDLLTTSETYGSYMMYIVPNDTMFQNVGDALYVTPIEIYNRPLLSSVTKDFDREYKNITNLVQDNSWKKGNTTYVTRSVVESSDLPFFSKVTSIDMAEGFVLDTYPSGSQIGVAYRDGVSCADFAEWVYYNPDAQMRLWVKSLKDATFELELHEGATGKNITVKATVSVTGSPDWQEIRLKRSDFATKSDFDNVFISGDYETCGIALFVSDITAGITVGDNLSFAQQVEFFTHEAYDKGDINRDNTVDARDLVRIKKFIANAETAFVHGDIDSDSKLTVTDLGYVRNWLMDDAWGTVA